MNGNEFISWVLDNTGHTLQEIADNVGFSRQNFYKWKEGETSPKKSTINKLVDYIGYDIKWNNDDIEIIGEKEEVKFEGEPEMGLQANTVIENQQQLIKSLNAEIKSLKKDKPDCPEFIDMDYDYRCVGEFWFENKKIMRKITNLENEDLFIEKLKVPQSKVDKLQFYVGGVTNILQGVAFEGLKVSAHDKIKAMYQIVKGGMFKGNPPPYFTTLEMTPYGNGYIEYANIGVSICLDDCKLFDLKMKFLEIPN